MLRKDLGGRGAGGPEGGPRERSSWPDLPAEGGKLRAADWSDKRPCKASEQLNKERYVFSYFLFQAFMEPLLTRQLVAIEEFSFVPGSTQN